MTERDPEALIRQALRAQVGGPRTMPQTGVGAPARFRTRLNTVQILLIAALIGLVIGMGIGFALI